MPYIDVLKHKRVAHSVSVYDLDTGRKVAKCLAVNTDEGWVEILVDPPVAGRVNGNRARMYGRFEVRDTRTGKRWQEIM